MTRALAWALIWFACLLVSVWTLIALPASAVFGSGRRGWRLAVSFDQLGNVAAGGDEDEVFSARCWRLRARPGYARWVRVIDWLFLKLAGETDHCRTAYEHEQARPRPVAPGLF